MGDTDSLKDKLGNHTYIILFIKYPGYGMKIMSTYYGFIEYLIKMVSTCSFINIAVEAKKAKFNYKITFENHFKYCHAVNGDNNLRHSSPSLEKTGSLHSDQKQSFILYSGHFRGQLLLAMLFFCVRKSRESSTTPKISNFFPMLS